MPPVINSSRASDQPAFVRRGRHLMIVRFPLRRGFAGGANSPQPRRFRRVPAQKSLPPPFLLQFQARAPLPRIRPLELFPFHNGFARSQMPPWLAPAGHFLSQPANVRLEVLALQPPFSTKHLS